MKTLYVIIIAIVLTVISGLLFYNIGYKTGYGYGVMMTEINRPVLSTDGLRQELKQREASDITTYLDSKSGVRTIDEGGLFTIDNVHYFEGNIQNNACLATAKDVVLEIDFLSKTGSKVGSQKITIYEFIKPQHEVHFRERIDLPEKYESFKFYVLKASAQ